MTEIEVFEMKEVDKLIVQNLLEFAVRFRVGLTDSELAGRICCAIIGIHGVQNIKRNYFIDLHTCEFLLVTLRFASAKPKH